jgi:DNA-binding NarL/FixJ family response regulator
MIWSYKVAELARVLLADDNPGILDIVKHMLQKDFTIVGAVSDAASVVRQTRELNPDVLILDISMGEVNGLQIARSLRMQRCLSKIIFLTVHEELEFIRAAFDAGGSGYVFKSRMHTDLCAALEAVNAGKVFIPHAPIPQ